CRASAFASSRSKRSARSASTCGSKIGRVDAARRRSRSTRRTAYACSVAALLAACGTSQSTPGGSPGPGDDAGDAGAVAMPDADPRPPPVVGSVAPAKAFLARHREVLIGGWSTQWTSAARVDLGPGITVTNLSVPTPKLVVVDFGVDLGAAT